MGLGGRGKLGDCIGRYRDPSQLRMLPTFGEWVVFQGSSRAPRVPSFVYDQLRVEGVGCNIAGLKFGV